MYMISIRPMKPCSASGGSGSKSLWRLFGFRLVSTLEIWYLNEGANWGSTICLISAPDHTTQHWNGWESFQSAFYCHQKHFGLEFRRSGCIWSVLHSCSSRSLHHKFSMSLSTPPPGAPPHPSPCRWSYRTTKLEPFVFDGWWISSGFHCSCSTERSFTTLKKCGLKSRKVLCLNLQSPRIWDLVLFFVLFCFFLPCSLLAS